MYKAVIKNPNKVYKTHDIWDIVDFIKENPEAEFMFFYNYEMLVPEVFLKYFLKKCKNYKEYLVLYKILMKPIGLFEYIYETHYK